MLSIPSKKPDPWPEAGWLCFPFKVDKPRFQLGRLGSIIDPAKDCRRGSNNEVFCLNSGMTVLDPAGAGAGLCSVTSPLVSLGHPGLFRYTKDFTPREPTVFVNLYNNQWGTNFQQWIGKVPAFTVPHLGGEEGFGRVGPDHAGLGSPATLSGRRVRWPGGRFGPVAGQIARRAIERGGPTGCPGFPGRRDQVGLGRTLLRRPNADRESSTSRSTAGTHCRWLL